MLLHRGVPIHVGSRALDLLHALVRRPGDLVRKEELIRFAWPNIFVHEANLKVNIAALRRALPRSQPDENYIATVPGRGYRFVAPVRVLGPPVGTVLPNAAGSGTGELPVASALIGRDEVTMEIVDTLSETRLLTIAGPAGVGKTSIAIAAARQVGERLKDGVCFIDLAAIEDPQLVAPAIAIAAGLDSNLVNVLAGLAEALGGRDMLLVLDNCEHVLSAVAAVADHLNHALPGLLVVATSREPLRCRWETVYRLAPLRCPSEGSEADAAAAMSFPAVELLVRRAEDHGYRLDDADLPVLAAISRRLDGIALAIELAAPRLSVDGPAELLGLLEHSFEPLASQKGTATARHMTLMATLDWSYRLLPGHDARLLRHLSVFTGTFVLEDVVGVCGHHAAAEDVATWLESLAARSLLSVSYHAGRRRYRLLDSTRSFASERLRAGGEQRAAMASYARYLLTLFEAAEDDWSWRTREDWTARYGHWANDLRRAIDWAFTIGEDVDLGVRLTASAVTFWNEFSSVAECRMRVKAALDATERLPSCDSILRLKLVAAHAVNGCFSSSLGAEVEAILKKGQRMADQFGNVEYHLRTTLGLIGVQAFAGRHRDVLSTVAQLRGIIETTGERSAVPDADRHEFTTRFYCGEIEHGHAGLKALAREHATIANRSRTSRFQLDRFIAIRNYLAVTTWVTGDHRGALGVAQDAVDAGAALDHAVSYTHSLAMAAIPVSLWCGLLDLAQEQVTKLVEKLALHQIDTWPPSARFYQAAIDAARGDANGVERMHRAIGELAACNLRTHFPMRLAMLAEAALVHDRLDLARPSIAEALEYADQREERWCSAELLRVLGLVRGRDGDAPGAGRAFEEAVRVAQQSGALSFELRAATSHAKLALQTGRSDAALAQLAAAYQRFDSSFHSTDVVAARKLLESL
ncbi:ATP-binding protein [Inquilinus limosus]|uniref:ATP-binding protein n=1 Tax=Inquilinus limosus TaxID=171674 RepID=UPI001C5290D4|nr:winged helix-turn-helix domain-containing protein [Inquilinus limosus]